MHKVELAWYVWNVILDYHLSEVRKRQSREKRMQAQTDEKFTSVLVLTLAFSRPLGRVCILRYASLICENQAVRSLKFQSLQLRHSLVPLSWFHNS